jgi:hypothetical protein
MLGMRSGVSQNLEPAVRNYCDYRCSWSGLVWARGFPASAAIMQALVNWIFAPAERSPSLTQKSAAMQI